MSLRDIAVFTGAGISGEAPACLARGFELRDALLELMHEAAMSCAPELTEPDDLDSLRRSDRKLEVVLGRLSGMVGRDALGCLRCLHLKVPNEAHLLAALHLAGGGTHLTLNFDVGIELAYDLLTGREGLSAEAPDALRMALPLWQVLVDGAPPLRVVVSHAEFDDWVSDDKPAALLKVHGSLVRDGSDVVDVVAEDVEELGQLAPSRQAAVEHLADFRQLLITGYAGADPDVYRPLLEAAQRTRSTWACYSLAADSPVPVDCNGRGIRLLLGSQSGLASRALGDLFDQSAPSWPEVAVDPVRWNERFVAWRDEFAQRHPRWLIATAWAWLLADGGDIDSAERLLRRISAAAPTAPATVRLADLLYDRGRATDRAEAAVLYRRLALGWRNGWSTRAHSIMRLGGVSRGRALRQSGARPAATFARSLAHPLAVLAWQQRPGADPDVTAAALHEVAHTLLRVIEVLALRLPKKTWGLLSRALRLVASGCARASGLARNGNRAALADTHRLLALALSDLLAGRQPADELRVEAQALADVYRYANDLPGVGNCLAVIAVQEMASGGDSPARRLEEARRWYAFGSDGGVPVRSGGALIERLTALHRRVQAR